MSVQIVANVLAPSEFNPLPSFAPPSKRKFCHQSYELCVKVPTLHAVTQFAKFLSRHPTNSEQNRESPTDLKCYFVCVDGTRARLEVVSPLGGKLIDRQKPKASFRFLRPTDFCLTSSADMPLST